MRKTKVSVFILCIILVILSGCGTVIGEKKADMAPVQSGEPVVYIHPFSSDLSQAQVVVLPFLVPEGTTQEEGLRVAAVFRDVFLAKETFHRTQLVDKYYGTLDEGLAIARKGELIYCWLDKFIISWLEQSLEAAGLMFPSAL